MMKQMVWILHSIRDSLERLGIFTTGSFHEFDEDRHRDRVNRRSVLIYALVLITMFGECAALIWNSAVFPGINPKADRMHEYAVITQDANTITAGDVFDRNGDLIVETGYKKLQIDTRMTSSGEEEPVYGIRQISHYTHGEAYTQVVGYILPRETVTDVENEKVSYSEKSADGSYRLMKYWYPTLYSTTSLDSRKGNSLTLTLDGPLQEAVYEALLEEVGTERAGSAVVMDAETGEILAMVSLPTVDLNNRKEAIQELNDEEKKDLEMQFPVTHKNYAVPGSIFKIVTDTCLRENGEQGFEAFDKNFNHFGKQIVDAGTPTGEQIGLTRAFTISSNTYFAHAATYIGADKLEATARRFMLGEDMLFDFGSVSSHFSLEPVGDAVGTGTREILLAETGYGQGYTGITTLNAAMIAQAIANDGVMMKPHLILGVTDENGNPATGIDKEGNEIVLEGAAVLSNVTSKPVADAVTKDMLSAVAGYSHLLSDEDRQLFESYQVAGKTGTGEVEKDGVKCNNAWFVSFAPADDSEYVVVVNEIITDKHGADLIDLTAGIYRELFNE